MIQCFKPFLVWPTTTTQETTEASVACALFFEVPYDDVDGRDRREHSDSLHQRWNALAMSEEAFSTEGAIPTPTALDAKRWYRLSNNDFVKRIKSELDHSDLQWEVMHRLATGSLTHNDAVVSAATFEHVKRRLNTIGLLDDSARPCIHASMHVATLAKRCIDHTLRSRLREIANARFVEVLHGACPLDKAVESLKSIVQTNKDDETDTVSKLESKVNAVAQQLASKLTTALPFCNEDGDLDKEQSPIRGVWVSHPRICTEDGKPYSTEAREQTQETQLAVIGGCFEDPIAVARRLVEQLAFTPDGVVVSTSEAEPRENATGALPHDGARQFTIGVHGCMQVNNGYPNASLDGRVPDMVLDIPSEDMRADMAGNGYLRNNIERASYKTRVSSNHLQQFDPRVRVRDELLIGIYCAAPEDDERGNCVEDGSEQKTFSDARAIAIKHGLTHRHYMDATPSSGKPKRRPGFGQSLRFFVKLISSRQLSATSTRKHSAFEQVDLAQIVQDAKSKPDPTNVKPTSALTKTSVEPVGAEGLTPGDFLTLALLTTPKPQSSTEDPRKSVHQDMMQSRPFTPSTPSEGEDPQPRVFQDLVC